MSLPRVVFASGSVRDLEVEVKLLGSDRVLFIATGSSAVTAAAAKTRLGQRVVASIDRVAMHVPVDVAEAAEGVAKDSAADLTIAMGGGSAIGLAKALAVSMGLPYVAVPTTYAGSEMTPIWGRTEHDHKITGRDDAALPQTVIYDPELTVSFPPMQSAASGMNAIAHSVEALYAPNATAATNEVATTGILGMLRALPDIVNAPEQLGPREQALRAAWMCGRALGSTQMGLHHSICHVLGGTFGLPHSAIHSAVLPYVVSWNHDYIEGTVGALQPLLGADPGLELWQFAGRISAPTSLAECGLVAGQIDEAARIVAEQMPTNPRRVDFGGVRDVLRAALSGDPPQVSTGLE
jgi:maleylacetate reductase